MTKYIIHRRPNWCLGVTRSAPFVGILSNLTGVFLYMCAQNQVGLVNQSISSVSACVDKLIATKGSIRYMK